MNSISAVPEKGIPTLLDVVESKTRWVEAEFKNFLEHYRLPLKILGVDEGNGNVLRFRYHDYQHPWCVSVFDARGISFPTELFTELNPSDPHWCLMNCQESILGALRLMFIEVGNYHHRSKQHLLQTRAAYFKLYLNEETDVLYLYSERLVMVIHRDHDEAAEIPSHAVFNFLDFQSDVEVKDSDVVTVAIEDSFVVVTHNGKAYNSAMWIETFNAAYENILDF